MIEFKEGFESFIVTTKLPDTYEEFVEEVVKILAIHNELVFYNLEQKGCLFTLEENLWEVQTDIALNLTKEWFSEQKDANKAADIVRATLYADLEDLSKSDLGDVYTLFEKRGLHLALNENGEIEFARRFAKFLDKSEYPYGVKVTIDRK